MGKVVVEVDGVPGEDLAALVSDALDARASAGGALPDGTPLQRFRLEVLPDPAPRPNGHQPPSSRYGELQQAKLQSGRFDAVTPADVVAWWASQYLQKFEAEDPALQAPRAVAEHANHVRAALRRYFNGDQRELLRYLTLCLRWWRLRRDREDRRASGFLRLRHALSSDWLLSMFRSGDMAREVGQR